MEIQPSRVQRLLVRGTNWIGDAVMSVPAMREIRRIFPRAHISLLVRPWVRDIYAAADFVDEILVYDRHGIHGGWFGRGRMAGEMRGRKFDLAILLQNAFEAALLVWWARIPLRVGYARYGRSPLLTHAIAVDAQVTGMHQAYYYLGLLAGAGLLERERRRPALTALDCSLGVRIEDRQAARTLLHDRGFREGGMLIGVNAGASYGGAKRWLPDRFAAVADHLAATQGARIVLFGSEQEREIADKVAAAMASPPINLAGRTTLGQLMALIRECSLLITNDSGPMHLAGALGVCQVALFGSTSEVATGPLGTHSMVLRHPVACSPCFLRECPIDFRCMTGISAARVIEAAERLLSETRSARAPQDHNPGPEAGAAK